MLPLESQSPLLSLCALSIKAHFVSNAFSDVISDVKANQCSH